MRAALAQPGALSLEKKSDFFKPIRCCVTFEAHSCPWKVSHRKSSKPSLTTSRMNSSGSQSYGWSPNSTDIGWDTTSHHCVVFQINCGGLGGGALEGEVPRTSIACALPWEKVKSMGRHFPQQMSSKIRSGGLLMAGRPECMKLPPSCAHTEPVPKMGKTLGMARQPYFINARNLC